MDMLVTWNRLENTARAMLDALNGKTYASMIATHHMGNVTLTDALRTTSAIIPPLSEQIEHFCIGMDALRGYRNYFVHGMIGTGKKVDGDGEVAGLILKMEVRAKVKLTEKALGQSELQEITRQFGDYLKFGDAIAKLVEIAMGEPEDYGHLSLPEKPLRPKTLEKTPRTEPISQPPPQSSRT